MHHPASVSLPGTFQGPPCFVAPAPLLAPTSGLTLRLIGANEAISVVNVNSFVRGNGIVRVIIVQKHSVISGNVFNSFW